MRGNRKYGFEAWFDKYNGMTGVMIDLFVSGVDQMHFIPCTKEEVMIEIKEDDLDFESYQQYAKLNWDSKQEIPA